jgi:hypothetical protein
MLPADCTAESAILAAMSTPSLTILGVFRPQISAETWQEQWQVTDNDEETREHFETLVLIEAVVSGLDEPLEMSAFGQTHPELWPDDPTNMQVGYDEGLLSTDGEELIQRDMDCVHGTGLLRFAVYLHMYDPERPLKWQRGEVTCPPVKDVPARLMVLMPYNACS